MNSVISTKAQAQIAQLNANTNEVLIKLQKESCKRFEAEKNNLLLLRKLKQYEDLRN